MSYDSYRSPEQEVMDEIGQKRTLRGRIAKKVLHGGSRLLKKTVVAVRKAIVSSLSMMTPVLAVVLAILLVVVAGWYIFYEIRGAEQRYSLDKKVEENKLELNDKGYFSSVDLSDKNRAILEFYTYYGTQKSFYQILGNDNTKLEQTDIRDYYQKEKNFTINPNFLFALDEFAFKGAYRYPEQFVKPVYYDPKTLKLKQLTDEKGMLTAMSTKYDQNGKPTKEKEKGIHDYGFASIFKYKKAQRTVTVEGVVYQKDVWDESCRCIKQMPTNEPFKEVMDGYPQDIWLITKAITFAGEYEFAYKEEKKPMNDLVDGVGVENSDRIKVPYGTYDEYREVCTVTKDKDGKEKEECHKEFVKRHTLYKYRKGKVYETIPVEDPSKNKDPDPKMRERYLRDYLYFFRVWIPQSAMTEFDFEERVGQIFNTNFSVGSGLNSPQFKRALQYLPIVEKYATMYGVDPYLVIAKIAQESGGDPNVEDGLMQITGDGAKTVKARNVQTGQYDTFTVYSEADRRNPEKAIRWGVMYFASKLERYDGDPLKALQSYNFDVMIIKEKHPEVWNSLQWMNYREEAREYYGRKELGVETRSVSYDCAPQLQKPKNLAVYGDVCYVEHVLRYYAGDQIKGLESHDAKSPTEKMMDEVKDTINNTVDKVLSFLGVKRKEYSEDEKHIEFKHYMSPKEVTSLLKSIKTFDDKVLFSEVENTDDVSFWEKGFTSKVGSMTEEEFSQLTGYAKYIPPLENIKSVPITSRFGMRWGKLHAGIDFGVPIGTPIYAIADGVVVKAVNDQGHSKVSWGNYVKIRHDGENYTLYGHMSEVVVKEGQMVKQGQLIGYSGNSGRSTGPHLHFEFYLGGPETDKRVDPYFVVAPYLK